MKRKTITLVVYMLVCISLVSVGFAAWIITGGDTETATGNVTATAVTDESITIDIVSWDYDTDKTGGTIKFGAPTNTAPTSGWLRYADGDMQQLETVCVFKISTGAASVGSAVTKLVSATLEVTDTPIDTLQSEGYIGNATIKYATATSAITSAPTFKDYSADQFFADLKTLSAQECYVAVQVSYNWGSNFGGQNPFEYFKPLKPGDESTVVKDESTGAKYKNKELASHYLTELYEGLDKTTGKQFNLIITVKGEGE